MRLCGFQLSRYTSAENGYDAQLLWGGEPVAGLSYDEDEFGIQATQLQESWNKQTLYDAVAAIHEEIPIPRYIPGDFVSCMEIMCELLRELEEMKEEYNRVFLKSSASFIGVYQTGNSWRLSEDDNAAPEHGYAVATQLYGSSQEEALKNLIQEINDEIQKSGLFLSCQSILIVDIINSTFPQELSASEYAEMHHLAKAHIRPTVQLTDNRKE